MSSNPQRPLVKPPDFIPLQSTQIINIPQNTSKAVISKNVHSSADEENGNGRANIMDSLNKPSLIPVNKPPLLSKPTLVSGNGQFEPISTSTPRAHPKQSHTTTAKEKESSNKIQDLKLNGTVGFDSLPYQLVRKCQSKGFQFNIMCVGETGLGKTTLIESLFNTKIDFQPCHHELKTIEIRQKIMEVLEGGVRVRLRVSETAGFGDQLDKDKSAKIIVDFINDQFESYLKEELKVTRSLETYDDTRIHVCLYFISPTGHGLKALDIVTLSEVSKRANVIPVISKSDTISKEELIRFKQKIMVELKSNNIEVYQFPIDDEIVKKENCALNALIPFAIIGSVDFVTKDDGRHVRARRYPWGIVEVENEEHCDFVKLREAILRVNEDALRERTHNVLYERYRRERFGQMKLADGDAGPKMMQSSIQRKKELLSDFERRNDQWAKQFVERVAKKEDEVKRHGELLDSRRRQADEKYKSELMTLEAEINNLLEEKAKLIKKQKGK